MDELDDNLKKDIQISDGVLIYLLDNCIFAYDQLCRINKELNDEHSKIKRKDFSSTVDMNKLGAMNRMIQDYLIIRVGGLFDTTKYSKKGGADEVISFEEKYSGNSIYKTARKQEIIKYIVDKRHNFVAHTNKKFDVPDSSKICNSNLKEILLSLKTLIS